MGVTVGGVIILYLWNMPLGPAIVLSTHTPSADTTLSPSSNSASLGSTQSASLNQLKTTVPFPTATPQPICNGPSTMTILAIGSDARDTGYLYGLADSIHIIRIDFTVPNIMVIDFPRDLWVEIPGISDHYGITHGKLNQAYFFGNPGMGYYDGPGEGPGLLARTLELNFGLRVDHYLAIDRQTFVHMVDAVGGVDINLDFPIDLNWGNATPDPRLYLSAGINHLDGEIALDMAVNRIPTTFQRMKYQKIILIALREKLLRPAMLPKIPLLVAQFITSIQTDLSPREINSLICISKVVSLDNIKANSFPQALFTASSTYDDYRKVTTFVYHADFEVLKLMVTEFMNGVWPIPEDGAVATPTP
jgi:LCP family protein required for cell wall assembly